MISTICTAAAVKSQARRVGASRGGAVDVDALTKHLAEVAKDSPAGNTTIMQDTIVWDTRDHMATLLTEAQAKWQSPALLAHNDAVITGA